jgi:hypothetical protein
MKIRRNNNDTYTAWVAGRPFIISRKKEPWLLLFSRTVYQRGAFRTTKKREMESHLLDVMLRRSAVVAAAMLILVAIVAPIQSSAQWFADPCISFSTRLHTMPIIDVGKQIGHVEFAPTFSYELGVNVATYGARTGYLIPLGYYEQTMLTILAGIGWTNSCGSSLEGEDQWTGIAGVTIQDTESRVGLSIRYQGGTFGIGFNYRLQNRPQ